MAKRRVPLLEETLSISEALFSNLSGLAPPINIISILVSTVVNAWDTLSTACSCLEFGAKRKLVVQVLLKSLQIHFTNNSTLLQTRRDVEIANSIILASLKEIEANLVGKSKVCWLHRDKVTVGESSAPDSITSLSCGSQIVTNDNNIDSLSTIPLDFFERFIAEYSSGSDCYQSVSDHKE